MGFMYWLLLFIKSVICVEYVKRIDFDLTFGRQGEYEYIYCKARGGAPAQEHLVYGDRFEIIAHLPYLANSSTDVAYMWCLDSDGNKVVERCQTKNIDNKSTCEVEGIYNFTTRGQWNCEYRMLMNSNRKVQPIVNMDSNSYTLANCILNATLGHLWFTGLDPNRRNINMNANSASYTYVFGANETLYIECIGPDRKQITFDYQSRIMSYSQPVELFWSSATNGLNGAKFTCKDKTSTYEIKLTLIAGHVWFTGLNPNQTYKNDASNYIYKYTRNEDIKIGCDTNMPGETLIRFHDIGTAEKDLENQDKIFYYTLTDGASGSYLMCICNYQYNGGGSVTAKLTFKLDKSSLQPPSTQTSTSTAVVIVTPEPKRKQQTPHSTTIKTVKPKQTKGQAAIELALKGTSVKHENKNEYVYMYTINEDELNLTCTSTLSMTKFPQAKYKLLMENERSPEQKTSSNVFTFSNKNKEMAISHIFKINGDGTIICSLWDTEDKFSPIPIFATLLYIFKPMPAAETEQGKGFFKENFTLILGIGAAVVLVCASLCAVVVFKKKSAASVEENYVNLGNNQTTYNTLPAPKPGTLIPHKPPTLEGNYSEPKDSKDMSDALYADPNRFRESTYAEPYIQTRDLYAKPIPKSQRKPKVADDPNYSNMFGKDYVNSSNSKK